MTEKKNTPNTARAPSSAYGERIRTWLATAERRFEAKAAGAVLELSMLDVVGEDPWTGGGITSKGVQAQLSANPDAKTIKVLLNSPGGDAFEGLAIQALLRRHGARVEIEIVGLAASAASIIAMAGDAISMHEGSLMMIHAPWSYAMGDATEMRTAAEFLDKVNSSALDVYERRTGRPRADIAELVADETWMTASEAVEQKFATAIIAGAEPEKTKKPKAAAQAFMSAWKPMAAPPPIEVPTAPQLPAQIEPPTTPPGPAARQRNQSPDGQEETPMKMISLVALAAVLGFNAETLEAAEEKDVLDAVNKLKAKAETVPAAVNMSGVKLLGVATEAEASAKIGEYQRSALQILGATGKANMAEAMPVLLDWKQRADQHAGLTGQIAQLTEESRVAKRDAALERMSREGSLPPARHDWARTQFSTAEAVETFCSGMPKGFFSAVVEQHKDGAVLILSPEEKHACQLTGVTEQAFLEQKKLDQQARQARVGG